MITAEQLAAISARVRETGPDEVHGVSMRKEWPHIHFTFCNDDDVTAAKPVQTNDTFNLYLVSSGGGCIGFTGNMETATGIVIAEIEDWGD